MRSPTWVIVCIAVLFPACATAHGPRRIEIESGEPGMSDWSRVSELAAGSEITMAVESAPPARRTFVRVEGSTLTVLNPDRALETIERRAILEIRGPVVARGSVLGAVVGGYLGFGVGVVAGLGGAPALVAWSWLTGSVAAGGYAGFHGSGHTTEGIVYRRPRRAR